MTVDSLLSLVLENLLSNYIHLTPPDTVVFIITYIY